MQVSVRTARPAEFDTVGDLTVAAYRALPVDHLWGGYEADIRDVAGRAESCDVLVAVDLHELVRGAVTFVERSRVPLAGVDGTGRTAVPAARGRRVGAAHGIGAALVRGCLERAGDRPVLIHTTRWMDAAQRLYERLGFVRRRDRDVPYSEWFDPARDHDLPRAWNGVSFLAYGFSPAG